MNNNTLASKFARIGARLKVTEGLNPRHRFEPNLPVRLDVQSDRQGEYFQIRRAPGAEANVEVLDVQPADRHLLLLVRQRGEKHKLLCGHDERHWFVAGVPEAASVGTVRSAKEALKPPEVQAAQARLGLRSRARARRKNAAYRRQGEWFFIPAPNLEVDEKLILRNEPITRGNGSKPHWVEFCYRIGGQTVYVAPRHPNGIDEREYQQLLNDQPKAKGWGWRVMRRDASVYVKGRVNHPDHRTIMLWGWHRVLMNTENQSRALRNVVAFLD
jgi:hypothetical protein